MKKKRKTTKWKCPRCYAVQTITKDSPTPFCNCNCKINKRNGLIMTRGGVFLRIDNEGNINRVFQSGESAQSVTYKQLEEIKRQSTLSVKNRTPTHRVMMTLAGLHMVRVFPDGDVDVGCQHIPRSLMLAVYRAAREKRKANKSKVDRTTYPPRR